MAIFMENTQVPDHQTVGEIQNYLAKSGARSVQVEYGERGAVNGVSFVLLVGEQRIPFKLPCRWEAVLKLMEKHGVRIPKRDMPELMARRIAWRQVKRWVEAQLAMVQTNMVKMEEVFLPYAMMSADGRTRTMFEHVTESKLLGHQKESK